MFILKIFFTGLIAFVPSKDGRELTVLMLNTPHAHHDTVRVGNEEHKPLLLIRAAACAPDCPRTNTEVSTFLYPEASPAGGADSLALAVDQGVVWQLSGSNVSLGIPKDGVKLVRSVSAAKSVPDNDIERADFGWVPSLKKIDPGITALRRAIFAKQPPEELIAARLTLTSGKVSTYSLIRVNDEVMPIDFRPLSGKGASYTRAAASWVEAVIEVPGDSLQITAERFSGGGKRTVSLKPRDGVIEMAILNTTSPTQRTRVAIPGPGTHFTRFWDLAVRPPAADRRAIPQVARGSVETRNYDRVHPERRSHLLEKVFPGDRTVYEALLCPMSQYP